MILVDTSLWINYFNGLSTKHTDTLDRILSDQTVLLGDIILTEVLQGFDSEKEFRLAKQALDPLDCVKLGGKSLAIKAASNFRFLQSKGITIRKTVDMLIASWCMEHNIELFHHNKYFDLIATQLPLKIYLS